MPAERSRPPAETPADPGCVHGQKVPGIDVEAVELLGAMGEAPVGEVCQRRVHRHRARQEFIEEEPIVHPGVSGFPDVAIDEPALCRFGKAQIENCLCQIVGGICDVELIFPLPVVLEICFQRRPRSGDPFLRPHFRIGEGGQRTGLAHQLVPEASTLQEGHRLPAVGPGQHAGKLVEPPVLVDASNVTRGILRQVQVTDARGQVRRGNLHPPSTVSVRIGPVLWQPLGEEDPVSQA